jgi:hypothetical protein
MEDGNSATIWYSPTVSGPNQHFLMQSILRGFAADRSDQSVRVYAFERDREPILEDTRKVGSENHFYSDPATDGAETLDDRITNYERHRLARILGVLRSAPSGTSIKQVDAAEFVDHITLRSAHLRRSFAEAGEIMAENAIDLFSKHTTVSGLLEVGDADGSIMSQAIDRMLKDQPQLARLGMPQRVLEEILRTFLEENDASLIGELRTGLGALRNALGGDLDRAVRAGHNAGLAKSLGRTPRTERLLAFQWTMERTKVDALILPDCVALAEVGGLPDLQPLNLAELDDVHVVLVPLAPRRLLVGCKAGGWVLPPTCDINRASALCSHTFFVSAVSTEELRRLSLRIGERNRGVINTLITQAIDETRVRIQSPRSKPSATAPTVVHVPLRPSQEANAYSVTFRDCADEADANRLAGAVFAIVSEVAKVEPLDRLDGITFAYDYAAAVRDLDRGFESSRKLTTRDDSIGMGVAMAPAVMRGGVIKKHIVMRAGIAWGLIGDDEVLRSKATYLLVSELMHVAYLQFVDDALPGTVLRPLKSPYEAILNAEVGGAPEAYFAARRSAPLFPDRIHELRVVASDALTQACESIPVQRRRYQQDRNLDALADIALTQIGSFILVTAELFGHWDGSEVAGAPADGNLMDALRRCGLERWAQRLHEELRSLWDRGGKWASYDEFLSINRFLEQALWRFRLVPWEVDGETPMYVLVLSD